MNDDYPDEGEQPSEEWQDGYKAGLAAAESQREVLDVETLARAMQLADYGTPVRDHQGRRVAFDELQEPFQTMLRQGAASILAALKEQPG